MLSLEHWAGGSSSGRKEGASVVSAHYSEVLVHNNASCAAARRIAPLISIKLLGGVGMKQMNSRLGKSKIKQFL